MNAMLGRLDESSQRQRQFVSDASHELRSPLASIRTNVEVALRNTDRADWSAVAARVLAEDERMEDTVERAAGPRSTRRAAGRHSDRVPPRGRPGRARPRRDRPRSPRAHQHHSGVRRARARPARAARPGGTEPARQRRSPRPDDGGDRAAQRRRVRRPSSSRSTTTVPAFRSRTASVSSTGSPASTTGAPATPVASVSGSRWCRTIVEQHGGTVTIGDAPIGGARITVSLPAV